jgi:hypothetical protein
MGWTQDERVEARWPDDNRWYAAIIADPYVDEGIVLVEWEDGGGCDELPTTEVRHPPGWIAGQPVRAKWSQDGRYYPATFIKMRGRKATVRWDEDGKIENVSIGDLRPATASRSVGAKQEAFQRLVNQRLDQARKYLRLLGNLANRGRYAYTSGQVRKMIADLQEELQALERKFGEALS